MEAIRKKEPLRKLNTKGCCFLCLKTENINEIEDPDNTQVLKSTSIRPLLVHLQIPYQSVDGGSLFGEDLKKENVQVGMCENCGQMTSRFSVLFQKLEGIQLEMNYFLEKIHNCISQSAKDPELVQNYSKRMTSDLEALSQLAFVDNLRKQVAKECLRKSNVPRLQLVLTPVKSKLIKTENDVETRNSNGGDIYGSCYLDEISPPLSPNSTADYEEDLQLKIASDFKEKFYQSHSLFKQKHVKEKKIKYFTKHPTTGMYECKKCDKKSHYQQTIRNHFKSVHLKLRHKCDICNISVFVRLSALTLHKKTCREKLEKKLAKEKDPNFKFICKICGKRFETNSKLKRHRFVHKNHKRFQCDLCGKKYSGKGKLKSHEAAIHQSRKFHCKICNKMFKYLQNFRRHERKCVENAKIKVESVECK